MQEVIVTLSLEIVQIYFLLLKYLSEIDYRNIDTYKSLFPYLISPVITVLSTYLLYKLGTSYLTKNTEISKFHEKYIGIKNEISIQKANMQIYGVHTDDYLDQFMKSHIKFINLLFEEILCAKNNDLLNNKLHDESSSNNWISSTCYEIIFNLQQIDSLLSNTDNSPKITDKFFSELSRLNSTCSQTSNIPKKNIENWQDLARQFKLINNEDKKSKKISKNMEIDILNQIKMALAHSLTNDLNFAKKNKGSKPVYQLVI